MTFRVLDPTEWGTIEQEFAVRGTSLPDPAHAFIVAAFEEGAKLAGFMVCQAQIHAEPLLLKNRYAFRGILRAVEAELARQFPGGVDYFCTTAPGATSSGMAELMGIKKLDLELRRKTILPVECAGAA